MNLKERLSSTENLLRAIRSGEAFASLRKPKDQRPAQDDTSTPRAKQSIWTRKISLGDLLRSGRGKQAAARRSSGDDRPAADEKSTRPKSAPAQDAAAGPAPDAQSPSALNAPAPHASPAKQSIWTRSMSFGPVKKTAMLGVSMTSGRLSLAIVSGGVIQFATRFPFGPDQAFGQKDFPAFLRTCLENVRDRAPQFRTWAVLRSQDLDLNVLSVPKLSGAKLDAAVYWTQQKEKKFAEAEYILDYLVLGPTKDAKEPRLDVLTCLARRMDVDRLRDAFREAGWPLEGITTLPSALQALYHLSGGPKAGDLAANIHVEEDASTIGLYSEGALRFSRFIRSGTDSMAEAVLTHFQDLAKPRQAQQPVVELELPPPGAPLAAQGGPGAEQDVLAPLSAFQAKGLLRHVLLGGPLPKDLSPGHVLTEAQMLEAIAPALDRLAKQVERTLEYYATAQHRRCDILHLSGRIFRNPRVVEALVGQLGYPHQAFDAPAMQPSGPEAVSPIDRMALAPALAACLSAPDRGINLLRNYKQRSAEQARQRAARMILLGVTAVLAAIGATGLVLESGVRTQREERDRVRSQLQALGPSIDEAQLTRAVAQFASRQEGLRKAAERFIAPVVLTELTRLAPASVKLLNVTMDLGVPPAAPAAPPPPGKPSAAQPTDLVTVEGIVTGDKAEMEPTLSRFVIELDASPLFSMPVVHQTNLTELGGQGQVLHFVMHMGVER